jgi:hypothetical protein
MLLSRGHRSYRVAILRQPPSGEVRELEIEHVFVRANNANHAMLAARFVTGAAVAMEAQRVAS